MTNTLEAEEWIHDLQDRMVEIIVIELNIEFFFFNEDRLRGLWDKINWISIHIIGVPEGGETEKDSKNIWRENRWKFL